MRTRQCKATAAGWGQPALIEDVIRVPGGVMAGPITCQWLVRTTVEPGMSQDLVQGKPGQQQVPDSTNSDRGSVRVGLGPGAVQGRSSRADWGQVRTRPEQWHSDMDA